MGHVKLKSTANDTFFSALATPSTTDMKRSVLRDVCIAISFVLLPFGINNAINGAYALAIVNLLFFLILVWNAWRLHHHTSHHITGGVILFAGTINIFFSVYQNGYIAIYWSYVGCVCAFLILDRRPAARFNVLFIILLLPLVTYSVDLGTSVRAASTLCLVTVVTYIFSSRLENRNRELMVRTQALEKATAAKSEFLANMSHEMRTPLTTVLGYSESILDDAALESKQREQLEVVIFNARHLANLINDILDISKIEAGQLEVALQKVELAPLVAELILTEEELVRKKGLDFVLTTELPLPRYLHIDAMRFNQILFNLIGNAIKFTSTGYVELAIEYHPANNNLTFSVRDSGIGVPVESRTKLFQQFSQIDSSITRDYGGTGLGLFISQRLAELMNGSIEYFPNSGGSEFQLALLLESKPDEWIDDEYSFRKVHCSRTQSSLQFTGHVLVAEDSPANQLLISLLVEKCGLQCTVVGNGLEAVEQLRNHHFNLVLMDLQMPIMSGIDATSAIRAFDQQTPVIALSADVLRHQNDSEEMAGFTALLAKPIDIDQLHAIFRRFLPVASTQGPPN
jgi:signal transduction histidine kinase/CheY-like chemotaxis protein